MAIRRFFITYFTSLLVLIGMPSLIEGRPALQSIPIIVLGVVLAYLLATDAAAQLRSWRFK